MKNKKNIILTGAQGTGKTTILKLFSEKHPEYTVVTEVVRKLAKKDGIRVNEHGDVTSQKKIFNTYVCKLSQNGIISDRGLTDVMGYTDWLADEMMDDVEGGALDFEYMRERDILMRYVKEYPAVYVYFPIEFAVEDDGFRSTSENFRHQIDKHIKRILDDNKIPYITVHGTPEERLEQIEKSIS